MDLFVEKEFIEEFELDYDCSNHKTEIQRILHSVFTEFPGIRLFLNAPDSFISDSRILSVFSDINLNITFEFDLESHFNSYPVLSFQTLVFTKEEKSWFPELRKQGALCFSYQNYEREIEKFINDTTFKVDLADEENIPVNWNIFQFLKQNSSLIIISDSYILSDRDGQKIKNNLVPLLTKNLNKKTPYTIFVFTEARKEDIESKVGFLNSALNGYQVKLFVINILPQFENIDLHDRILYSNFTITDAGKGFNLYSKKPKNSQIVSASIFEKYTYKRFNNHLKELGKYVDKLEKSDHAAKPYKTNSVKSFDAFRKILFS
jgi:hypothetical protein